MEIIIMYRHNEEVRRNKKIKELRNKNPKHWTYERLANKFNVSRQRIGEILSTSYSDSQKLEKVQQVVDKASEKIKKIIRS